MHSAYRSHNLLVLIFIITNVSSLQLCSTRNRICNTVYCLITSDLSAWR